MTHDLMRDILQEMNTEVERIVINELVDQTFFAVIRMSSNGKQAEVSSRPSDAIALAVRINAPLYASEEVLEAAGIELKDEEESEVEKFREFLDQVNPEDFAQGQA
jgi:bifunctional DNase/RNase